MKQGFKKFVSNPYESHTAGDPYSDLEKASGALDRTIHKVARDPLVAAYPSITVGMEELILSNNENISSTKGKTVSRSTSSSVSDSNTLGIDVSTGFLFFKDFQHLLPAIIPIPLRIPLILPILQGKIGSIN
ncbi:hypothetical protein P7H15_06280 [Paenibacillus larvae]|nr:binary toxin-like calcium binding domain-containing protein [Paenibacillus larvae]MDT2292599.1 hypothetical protein [Paenibacillus larvae]